jgi:hypothetical protein
MVEVSTSACSSVIAAVMPQGVRGNALGREGRAGFRGGGDVFGEEVGDGVAAEMPASAVGEQRIGGCGVPVGDPPLEQPGGGSGQRGASLFAAFTDPVDDSMTRSAC